MQNRYVGDVGDYGKYALLRAMMGLNPRDDDELLRLGIVWCFVRDDEHNADGEKRSYLKIPAFRGLDPHLYDVLAGIKKQYRRVKGIARTRIFPRSTVFFTDELPAEEASIPAQGDGDERQSLRGLWVDRALRATKGCDVVFFDPDNGLAPGGVAPASRKARKYVFPEELRSFRERGQSLVVYHHLCRNGTAEEQIEERKKELAEALGARMVLAIPFRRGTCRTFFVVPAPGHVRILRRRITAWLKGGWIEHARGRSDPDANPDDFLR